MSIYRLLKSPLEVSFHFLERHPLRCVVDIQSTREPEIAGFQYDNAQITDSDDME